MLAKEVAQSIQNYLASAEAERAQAARLRSAKQPVGYEHLAQAYEDAASNHEAKARALEGQMLAHVTERRQRDPGAWSSREVLVKVARQAAATIFTPRKVAPSEAALKKAREAAFKAIRRHDPLAGTQDHPNAAYSHGIAELAAEGTEEARRQWLASRAEAHGTRRGERELRRK